MFGMTENNKLNEKALREDRRLALEKEEAAFYQLIDVCHVPLHGVYREHHGIYDYIECDIGPHAERHIRYHHLHIAIYYSGDNLIVFQERENRICQGDNRPHTSRRGYSLRNNKAQTIHSSSDNPVALHLRLYTPQPVLSCL